MACPAQRWLRDTLDTVGFKDFIMMDRSLEEAAVNRPDRKVGIVKQPGKEHRRCGTGFLEIYATICL